MDILHMMQDSNYNPSPTGREPQIIKIDTVYSIRVYNTYQQVDKGYRRDFYNNGDTIITRLLLGN